jgi:DNA-binding transcriptional LysR family regulator
MGGGVRLDRHSCLMVETSRILFWNSACQSSLTSECLAIFAKVVQMHSFVGAATDLRLSKATVSKAVSRIERKLGTRLFNRAARRLALTESGRQLYDRAARVLAEAEAAEDDGSAIGRAARPRTSHGADVVRAPSRCSHTFRISGTLSRGHDRFAFERLACRLAWRGI